MDSRAVGEHRSLESALVVFSSFIFLICSIVSVSELKSGDCG